MPHAARPSLAALAFVLALLPTAAWAGKMPIAPGEYECRISRGYKFRPCQVVATESGATLTIPDVGHLIVLTGPLYAVDDRPKQAFWEAHLAGERPWPCYRCQPSCSVEGSSCVCKEVPLRGSSECREQAVRVVLERKGRSWSGHVAVRMYWSKLDPTTRKVDGWEFTIDTFLMTLRPAR